MQHAHFKAHAIQSHLGDPKRRLGTTVPGSDGHNVTLLPIDASLMPGIRAFNFLGYLSEQEYSRIQEAAISESDQKETILEVNYGLQIVFKWIFFLNVLPSFH